MQKIFLCFIVEVSEVTTSGYGAGGQPIYNLIIKGCAMVKKILLNSQSNRSKLAYIVKRNNNVTTLQPIQVDDVAGPAIDDESVRPDTVTIHHKFKMKKPLGFSNKSHNACRQYGNLWLEFDNTWNTVYSSSDRQNFYNAIKLACEYCRKKDDYVTILGVRDELKKSGINIIDYKVITVLVKDYLAKNPNPKKSNGNRKGHNTVRHNDYSGQECPCTGMLKGSDVYIKKLISMSEW